MGIFSRFRDIVSANINAMLDGAEDPEKMIRQIIREMEDTLVDLKASCAEKIALNRELKRERDAAAEKTTRWEARARMAVDKGKDDLAREALVEKKRAQQRLEEMDGELEQLNAIIDETKEGIVRMEEKLREAWQKRKILLSRGAHAQEIKRKNNTLRKAGNEAALRFAEFERKIERMEADAEMSHYGSSSENESAFADLEHEGEKGEIEEELARMKEQKTAEV